MLIKKNPYINFVRGKLCIGEGQRPIADVLGSYRGPTYIYDTSIIDQQVQAYQEVLPANFRMHFAMKANANPEVLRHLLSKGVDLDVVSAGEIRIGLEVGFKPEQIIFSGVGKTKKEIEFAIDVGVKQINIESLPELDRVLTLAAKLQKYVNVAVRINPDISVQTHPYISTGLRENKFGLELESLAKFEEKILNQKFATWRGISVHLGSQIFEVNPMRDALRSLIEIQNKFKVTSPHLNRIDLGGGVGIDYEKFDHLKEQHFLQLYAEMIHEELDGLNCEFMIEPGRSIVAHSGVLVCEVQYVKETKEKTFVILDSGMNHLLRPSLYNAKHQVYPIELRDEASIQCDIVGPICESSDVLVRDYKMPRPREGDLVAICDVGAYGYTMASRYNQHELPAEIVI